MFVNWEAQQDFYEILISKLTQTTTGTARRRMLASFSFSNSLWSVALEASQSKTIILFFTRLMNWFRTQWWIQCEMFCLISQTVWIRCPRNLGWWRAWSALKYLNYFHKRSHTGQYANMDEAYIRHDRASSHRTNNNFWIQAKAPELKKKWWNFNFKQQNLGSLLNSQT